MYEVTNQILCYPQYTSHAENKKAYKLEQGVEPKNHWLMMVDTNCEYGSNRTRVNLLELWKMDPTMVIKLGRDELDNKLYSSGDDSYHIADNSDYGMEIRGSDTDSKIQEPFKPSNQNNRAKLSKLFTINIKQVTSTFREPTVNANKLGNMWVISTKKANELIRTTNQAAVRDITKPLTRQFMTRQSLLRL